MARIGILTCSNATQDLGWDTGKGKRRDSGRGGVVAAAHAGRGASGCSPMLHLTLQTISSAGT